MTMFHIARVHIYYSLNKTLSVSNEQNKFCESQQPVADTDVTFWERLFIGWVQRNCPTIRPGKQRKLLILAYRQHYVQTFHCSCYRWFHRRSERWLSMLVKPDRPSDVITGNCDAGLWRISRECDITGPDQPHGCIQTLHCVCKGSCCSKGKVQFGRRKILLFVFTERLVVYCSVQDYNVHLHCTPGYTDSNVNGGMRSFSNT